MRPPRHPSSARPCLPAVVPAWIFLLLSLAMLRGADLPPAVILNFPISANQALPAWLQQPILAATTFATLGLPILSPDPGASLLVTVYFQEKPGGFMRITWTGPQGAQVLSDNFYESIGMANQRSLLISPSVLAGDGTLGFQCGDSTLGIQRIKLEWLQSRTGLVSPAVPDVLVTLSSGQTLAAPAVNGQPAPAQPAAWQDALVNVPLADQPVRIEEGVEFSVDLDNVPGTARVALKESGMPLGQHLVVWVNEQLAGTITPALPDLTDDGFLKGADGLTQYVGWREGSFYVPVSLLKAGVNTLQFSDEDDVPGAAAPIATSEAGPPLALKDIVFQLGYQAAPPSASPPPPQFLLGPMEPLSLEPSTSSPTHTP